MTPQSSFMVSAPIDPAQLAGLKALLASMNVRDRPGSADPANPFLPFASFAKLHYARFVILDDQTLGDFDRIGEPVPEYPVELAFLGDCDGPAEDFLRELAERAGAGLRQIFSHCEGFDANTDLRRWMRQHSLPAAAAYVNHIGRTVDQIHREDALRKGLVKFLKDNPPPATETPEQTRNRLLAHAGQNNLIPPPGQSTPIGWQVRNILHFLSLPIVAGVFLVVSIAALWIVIGIVAGIAYPFPMAFLALVFLIVALIFIAVFRTYEIAEPQIVVRPSDPHAEELGALEDYDAVNQFSVIGSVKPSAFRRRMLRVNLWAIDWVARHVYNRRYLARIRTIHFARWTFMDNNRRVMFASSYDGSLESYNDDFINKGGFGLNFAFGVALGYPRTRWVLFDGAKDEQKFKYVLRRHQIPTQVWYNAYPSLTVYDLARNARVRDGIERETMSDAEIRAWLADL
jgi:hypothetical protein